MFSGRVLSAASSVITHGITQHMVGMCKRQLDLLNVVRSTSNVTLCTYIYIVITAINQILWILFNATMSHLYGVKAVINLFYAEAAKIIQCIQLQTK